MDNIFTTYLGGLILIVVAGFFISPKFGFIKKIKKNKTNTERILIEDSLKHIFDCMQQNKTANVNSLAGNLSISVDKAAKILNRLNELKLTIQENGGIILTEEGKDNAVKVIRIHRLWERYLADETSVSETEWHNSAEEVEHYMTQEEANLLSAKIGNPLIDPHGDPIPDKDGKIAVQEGKLFNTLEIGEEGQILHTEDEPESIYKVIVSKDLFPGKHLRVTNKINDKIYFQANGKDESLTLTEAANISISQIPDDEKVEHYRTLTTLKQGEEAEIVGISRACRGVQRRRLMDLGIVPKSKIRKELISPGGDPAAYLIKGALIALRKKQSDMIYIR